MLKVFLVVSTMILSHSSLFAQSPVQMFAAGSLVVAGRAVSCGHSIAVYDLSLKEPAAADTNGRILLNPHWFAAQPPLLQLWRYSFECARLMGHKTELAADCWAIANAERQGWFSVAEFPQLKAIFARSSRGSVPLPGSERVAAMEQCFARSRPDQPLAAATP